jgi:chromosome segregation ATPase
MATIEELQAELATVTADRDDWKTKHKDVSDEAKGHRLNANKFKGQLETLQSQVDTLTNERDEQSTSRAAEIERVRVDLTAQLNAKQAELTTRINVDKTRRTDEMLADAAKKLGLIDADGFLKVVDRANLKIADDGSVENADAVAETFKAERPYFFGVVQRPGTTTGTTTSTTTPPKPGTPSGFDARTAPAVDYGAAKRAMLAASGSR